MNQLQHSRPDENNRRHMRKDSRLVRIVIVTSFVFLLFFTVNAGQTVPDGTPSIVQVVTDICSSLLGSGSTTSSSSTNPPADSTGICGHDPIPNPPPPPAN